MKKEKEKPMKKPLQHVTRYKRVNGEEVQYKYTYSRIARVHPDLYQAVLSLAEKKLAKKYFYKKTFRSTELLTEIFEFYYETYNNDDEIQ